MSISGVCLPVLLLSISPHQIILWLDIRCAVAAFYSNDKKNIRNSRGSFRPKKPFFHGLTCVIQNFFFYRGLPWCAECIPRPSEGTMFRGVWWAKDLGWSQGLLYVFCWWLSCHHPKWTDTLGYLAPYRGKVCRWTQGSDQFNVYYRIHKDNKVRKKMFYPLGLRWIPKFMPAAIFNICSYHFNICQLLIDRAYKYSDVALSDDAGVGPEP